MKQNKDALSKYNHVNWPVYNFISPGSVVLDVGCWNGSLGKVLIREKGCIVDGIDGNEKGIAQAKKYGYDRVFLKDLNDLTRLEIPSRKYDYVVIADVLEHILNPHEVLIHYSKYLKKEGRVIISLPNIGFLLYRLQHLFGRFDYKHVGVMDRTHLKFYTLKTMNNMFRECGFTVEKTTSYNEVAPKYFLLQWLKEIRPTVFALQFVFMLKKEGKKNHV